MELSPAALGKKLRNLLHPRRKSFWVLAAVLLYALAGFFLAPVLIKNALIETVRTDLEREAVIGRVELNPFALSSSIQDFELNDIDGTLLFSFDELYVDFQLSSLFRWAWSFRAIHLERPYAYLERFENGESRLGRLLADLQSQEPDTESRVAAKLPRLYAHSVVLSEGRARLRDNVPAQTFQTTVGPINVAIETLTTLSDRDGRQHVRVELPRGAVLQWNGTLSLAPFASEGDLLLKGSHLQAAIAYLEALLPLEAVEARLSLGFDYRISMAPSGGLDVDIDRLAILLEELKLTGLDPVTEFLAIPRVRISGGTLRYPERTAQFDALRIGEPQLRAWLDRNLQPSLAQLTPGPPPGEVAGGGAEIPAWSVGIRIFELSDGKLDFSDRSIRPEGAIGLEAIDFRLEDYSNQAGAIMPLRLSAALAAGGTIEVGGALSLLPDVGVQASARTVGIPLTLLQPYVDRVAKIAIENGSLDSQLAVTVSGGVLDSLSGTVDVPGLKILDATANEPLLGWKSLRLTGLRILPKQERLEMAEVTMDQPFGRVVIFQDQTTNLGKLIVDRPQAGDGRADESATLRARIGGIIVREGELDFSDRSLPFPFSAKISGLGGSVSTVSTVSEEPAEIDLEGKVNEFGLARIEGELTPFDPLRNTNIRMDFRNLSMSGLSPYSVQFAGREIAGGKLDLDLAYTIDNARLTGRNDIVLSDLVLGDKVDHPGAASLPLGLAVALLKDRNGVIDVELPVEGDVNDPQFRIGGVIWQAIRGLITKVAAAPFRLLGNLIGVDSEDLGRFQFLAGRADLTPPEREEIAKLLKALQQRPELAIEIPPVYAPDVDRPALQLKRLREAVFNRLPEGSDIAADGPGALRLDTRVRTILEELFAERFPDEPLDGMKSRHLVASVDNPQADPVLDEAAYTAELRERLLETISISDAQLVDLARARAAAVRNAFLAESELEERRVVTAAVEESETIEDDWVVMELGVAAD